MKTNPNFTLVHVIASFTGGGAERFVVNLCNTLAQNTSRNVHIVALYDIDANMFLHHNVDTAVTIHTLGKSPGLDVAMFVKLYSKIKALRPHVVHTHLRAFNYNYLNLLCNSSPKYYHTLHSDAVLECPSDKNRALRRLFYKKQVIPVTISNESAKSFKAVYQLNTDVLIPNGTLKVEKTEAFDEVKHEVEAYKHNTNTRVFVHVANLLPVKQHEVLVKAFANCVKQGLNAVLLLIGDRRPEDTTIYNSIIQHKGTHIKYLGVKHNVADYLLNADVFVLVSKIEGMPISLIEAMSAKCIPLVTPVGGMLNMITHNTNGWLTKGTTTTDIAEAIQQFMQLNTEELRRLAKNAELAFTTNYDIARAECKYMELYNRN